jgi:hypothetical protein
MYLQLAFLLLCNVFPLNVSPTGKKSDASLGLKINFHRKVGVGLI